MKRYIGIGVMILLIWILQHSFANSNEPVGKAALGKLLFFDPLLSRNRTISCATCHKPAFAFADTTPVSIGIAGRKGKRNTPTVMNMVTRRLQFWDGRAKTLEEQAVAPIENPDEMDLPVDSALQRLTDSKLYAAYFDKMYKSAPTRENLGDAIAAFERTLETFESPFDNWKVNDDSAAVSESVKRGFVLFSTKGKCTQCHFGGDFTQHEFRNIGLFNGIALNDSGRILISKNSEDLGKFKTPQLRNIGITAPYMHNGMFETLDQVIDFYNEPDQFVLGAINRDSILAQPLGLSINEKTDLKAFLLSLTDKRFVKTP